MNPLAGRVALVAGASRGIGAAVASALEAHGATVVAVARSLDDGWTERRVNCRADLSDPAQVSTLTARVRSELGVPDVVVSNAGAFLLSSLETTEPAAFDRQLAANLRAPFLLARAFLPLMRNKGPGRFITIGSIADHRALPQNAAYAAAKFGLRGLHEVLREEFRGTGVLCTLISPGPTDTAAWDPIDPDARPGFTPRRAMLRPEDVADAVCWVAARPLHVDVDWIRLGPASAGR